MVGDDSVVNAEYHHLFDFVLRRNITDSKVFRQSFIVTATTFEEYRDRILDIRLLIADIAASFTYPVYICERITEIPTTEAEA